jgi:hypothetical protein
MTQGICAIHQRMNPRLVGHKLRSYSNRIPRVEEVAAGMARSAARPATTSRLPA